MKTRKQLIFDKFSNQLTLLKNNGLLDCELKYERTYICPLCLNQFSDSDLTPKLFKNYLTEEDAPPASLGGSRVALTCKKCNSECGHNIDYQLKELIEHEENSRFIKGSVQRGTVDFEGRQITVEMKSKGKGNLQASHDENRNDPSIFQRFINSIREGSVINFIPKKNRLDPNKLCYAFFKTNYIITFSKFGYLFLLDPAYNELREQILNPNVVLIDYNLAIHNPHFNDHIGTHYVTDAGIKAIFNIFNLKTKLSEKPYGVFLPIPSISIESFVTEMETKRVDGMAQFNKTIYDDDADLFNDIEEIRKIKNWIGSE